MLIGLLVAIGFNADSFKVATTLWNDPDRRASIVARATEIAKTSLPKSEEAQAAGQQQDKDKDKNKEEEAATQKLRKQVEQTELNLRSLPIGWSCMPKSVGDITSYVSLKGKLGECWKEFKDEHSPLVHFLGWLLTAAALSLGAPFWFDLLNKFINLRGAGQKPARADQKSG